MLLLNNFLCLNKKLIKKGSILINNKNEKKEITRGTKWLLTFNNPKQHGYNTERPEDMEQYFKIAQERWASIKYMCVTKEIGEQGTEHDHLFLYFSNSVYMTSIQKVFPHCDIRLRDKSVEANRNYVFKIDNDEKEDTKQIGYQFEWGELPQAQGARNDWEELKTLLAAGYTNNQIFEHNAKYMKYRGNMDKLRIDLLTDKYRDNWRDVKTIYVQGATGTGKTRSIMDKYGYKNCCRVRKGDYPFNNYVNQDVVIFEEFRNTFTLEDMLYYLDGYPIEDLRGMYSLRTACWHNVFICSNWQLEQQYKTIQENYPEDWQAFLRRIDTVRVKTASGFIDYNRINIGTDDKPQFDFMADDGTSYFNPLKNYNDNDDNNNDNDTSLFDF